MLWAREVATPTVANELQEIIFRLYFTDGVFLDTVSLALAAEEAGLPPSEARLVLESGRFAKQAREAVSEAKCAGIIAVPTFFINGEFVFSGPQSPEAFLDAFGKS